MVAMTTKTASKSAESFRYEPEDLEPRDPAAAEASLDAYLRRNKDAINASIEPDHAEFERGEYFTLDQVMADIDAERQRRPTRKS
jgi:predicted transcriptional regulator